MFKFNIRIMEYWGNLEDLEDYHKCDTRYAIMNIVQTIVMPIINIPYD